MAVILWQRCHSPPIMHRCQLFRISGEVNAHRISKCSGWGYRLWQTWWIYVCMFANSRTLCSNTDFFVSLKILPFFYLSALCLSLAFYCSNRGRFIWLGLCTNRDGLVECPNVLNGPSNFTQNGCYNHVTIFHFSSSHPSHRPTYLILLLITATSHCFW